MKAIITWKALFFCVIISTTGAFTQQSLLQTSKRASIESIHSSLSSLFAVIDPITVNKNDVSSSLISNLAIIALKIRLAKNSGVSCKVNASSSKIMFDGMVGPICVKGRGWESPLGLSCRAIEAQVESCFLDIRSIIQNRKIKLIEPAIGQAMVALNKDDFGNFITHPLLTSQAPNLPGREDGLFEFVKDDVEIHSDEEAGGGGGEIIFYGNCLGKKWRCKLRRASGSTSSSNRSIIEVEHAFSTTPHEEIDSIELSSSLSKFFNELVFELDGTYLSFKDLVVHSSPERLKNGKSTIDSSALIALGIRVKKFPSPGLPF